MKCTECGRVMTSRRCDHRYVECGLRNVVLKDVQIRHCGNCGNEELGIRRIEELHRVVAHVIAMKHERLRPAEIRFLRKSLGLSGVDFARKMGVAPETVSRWERKDKPLAMSRSAERLLRVLVFFEEPVEQYDRRGLDLGSVGTQEPSSRTVRLAPSATGWRELAA